MMTGMTILLALVHSRSFPNYKVDFSIAVPVQLLSKTGQFCVNLISTDRISSLKHYANALYVTDSF